MYQDGFDSTSPEAVHAARTMSSSRLRGVLRHGWINNGLSAFPDAKPIHWSAGIEEANIIRRGFGLSPLNPDHDPAPDLIEASASQSSLNPQSRLNQVNQATAPSSVAMVSSLPKALQWTSIGRLAIFLLAATSILCLLTDAEGFVTLRSVFFAILTPACISLLLIAALNRARGEGQLFRAIKFGAFAGLAGAIVFFVFRIPFVFSHELGLDQYGVRHFPFFNIYPRIGAMILGQEVVQPSYEPMTYVIGWGIHLIRATTTGIMLAAILGELQANLQERPQASAFNWEAGLCGALLTVVIQSCLLLSPYSKLFSIQFTPTFVFTLLLAHVSFGISIGFFYSWYSFRRSSNSSRSSLSSH